MKKIVKIGLIQMRCSIDRKDNLKRAIEAIHDVARKGAQIICLPELFLSHYFCQSKDKKNFALAESVPGQTTEIMQALAKKNRTVILCPLFEKTASGKFFNSVAVIGINGEIIGTYHKMHIPSLPPDLYAEDFYFEKGDGGFPIFETPYAKIAPMICYDQWFPEGARIAAAKGAQILFYPTAIGWPERDQLEKRMKEHEAWQIIQRSHSIANNVFVVVVNRIGIEHHLNFWGTSFVSDPYGMVLAKAPTDKEINLVIECDLSVIEKMRKEWQFLSERRIQCEKIL